MPKLLPADLDFIQNAPSKYSDTFDIPLPAEQVWAEIASEKPLDWCRGLNITWTSPAPRGVGATRTAKVLGALKVQEEYFLWEEGRRNAFFVVSANVPVFKRLAEDYLVEPNGTDRCTFTWTIGIEATAAGKPGAPLNALIFKRLFSDTRKHFNAA